MHKATAYEALASELERWRSMPAPDLLANIGKPATVLPVSIDGEDIAIEITVQRHYRDPDAVRITATANGPSHWRLERLVESIVVRMD
jgi:hypothetical protein